MKNNYSIKHYPVDRIYEEMAYIAYHFHWSYSELMQMDHLERQRWCKEISKIIEKINNNGTKIEEKEVKINRFEFGRQ
jgi:hypothetical protein